MCAAKTTFYRKDLDLAHDQLRLEYDVEYTLPLRRDVELCNVVTSLLDWRWRSFG